VRQKSVRWCVELLCVPENRARCISAGMYFTKSLMFKVLSRKECGGIDSELRTVSKGRKSSSYISVFFIPLKYFLWSCIVMCE
jgi:hypothetical protein